MEVIAKHFPSMERISMTYLWFISSFNSIYRTHTYTHVNTHKDILNTQMHFLKSNRLEIIHRIQNRPNHSLVELFDTHVQLARVVCHLTFGYKRT